MEVTDLIMPIGPENGNMIFGTSVAPLDKLKILSDKAFEEMINEWAYSYLKNKYSSVHLLGGAGDKGRDIIAYFDFSKEKSDIYQCKHYKSPLTPTEYWIEFGKLCYYTFINDYKIPENYYIVASQSVGPSLRSYIDNPKGINKGLIDNWDKYCKSQITKGKKIILNAKFKSYIEAFDFSIVQDIEPIKLLDQYSQTKWFKYRFGGGIPKRPKPEKPPTDIGDEEKKLEYIKELTNVYCEYTDGKLKDLDDLKKDYTLYDHLSRQREDYYCAQSLKQFSRDEFIGDPYEEAKNEIFRSVIDVCYKDYPKSFERVNETTGEARIISLDGNEMGKVNPSDKSGMCHELVNDSRLKWVIINE